MNGDQNKFIFHDFVRNQYKFFTVPANNDISSRSNVKIPLRTETEYSFDLSEFEASDTRPMFQVVRPNDFERYNELTKN